MQKLLLTNLEYNTQLKCKNIDRFTDKYNNKSIVIVSAGPSLDKNKHMLKELGGKQIFFQLEEH